jgi:hypothetical protein
VASALSTLKIELRLEKVGEDDSYKEQLLWSGVRTVNSENRTEVKRLVKRRLHTVPLEQLFRSGICTVNPENRTEIRTLVKTTVPRNSCSTVASALSTLKIELR